MTFIYTRSSIVTEGLNGKAEIIGLCVSIRLLLGPDLFERSDI